MDAEKAYFEAARISHMGVHTANAAFDDAKGNEKLAQDLAEIFEQQEPSYKIWHGLPAQGNRGPDGEICDINMMCDFDEVRMWQDRTEELDAAILVNLTANDAIM